MTAVAALRGRLALARRGRAGRHAGVQADGAATAGGSPSRGSGGSDNGREGDWQREGARVKEATTAVIWRRRRRWCSALGKEWTTAAVLLLNLNGEDSGRWQRRSMLGKERMAVAVLLLDLNGEDGGRRRCSFSLRTGRDGDTVEGCGAVVLLLFDPNEEDNDGQRHGAHRRGRGKSSLTWAWEFGHPAYPPQPGSNKQKL
uniref:DUF834 domain-containing protein n=1 Tax=Oryza punctata TaxID=4537 RepID=A0A0E0KTX0_ORYPU